MVKRAGKQTLILDSSPSVAGFAAVASQKEGEGPLGKEFDIVNEDAYFGEKTWEKAESRIQKEAITTAMEKAGVVPQNLQIVFAGDLLNQCIGSAYAMRDMGVPFVGLYGACSTMAESLSLASLFVDSGIAECAAAVTSSHFCSAERQFRFPLEYGGVRTPTSQWTVTGGGAAIVKAGDVAPFVKKVCFGKVTDLGVTDINNMGAAMAPAAADTLSQYFEDTLTSADNYDMIFTGDLGYVGSELMCELLKKEWIDLGKKHTDCGKLIYDKSQKVDAGGSGCGCSAAVLCSYIMSRIKRGEWRNVLFMATGALMSPTSNQQGESIPGIAHLVHLSADKN
ncbi:MAG: stage V sporulation protein AD [Oscillospiraceae bacterium]|nr:stage V sporulation protein AD [Oscillospiraceae bacterium]MBQ3048646.1 stage V sporulation protein AD [Oscillospiraceae bacterium]MBQ9939145.1 stage V sporulation protein AD [Oscillospiraceae bacterium]